LVSDQIPAPVSAKSPKYTVVITGNLRGSSHQAVGKEVKDPGLS
jgi:hypothetical protein